MEDWPNIDGWMDGVLSSIVTLDLKTGTDYLDLSTSSEETGHSRTKPFMAKMIVRENRYT